jgi:hypothetical protein
MNENRRQILEMLAAGKITADEAERLIAALEPEQAATAGAFTGNISGSKVWPDTPVKTSAKYLRVLVGVRLASLIPQQAHDQLDETLSKHGVPLTLSQIKPENLEELIDHLGDLTVDVDAKEEKAKVRVFCE